MSDIPSNAPEQCPGTSSDTAGNSAACAGCPNQAVCASTPKGLDPDMAAISEKMKGVKRQQGGLEVGLLDIDICGPSIPKMLGMEGQEVHQSNHGWSPVYLEDNLAVMSIGFMLPNPDEAVIWRGPRKNSLIKQFLKDVHWGNLDYLVVDAPPGTSDEHITIAQCLKGEGTSVSAVIVTTPQEVALIDVRKEINFCKKVGINILGVVENMSGLQQRLPLVRFEHANLGSGSRVDITEKVSAILKAGLGLSSLEELIVCTDVFDGSMGGTEKMCSEMDVSLLGKIPMDPALGRAAESGRSVLSIGRKDGDTAEDDASAQFKPALCEAALRSIVARVVNIATSMQLTS
ncbi:hypothetical protein CEUSTIGMA_g7585.t1 [Chlamydomonas eustigma]|uniref:Cytosolic Fe-S cluster assembly factor NBP35 n=1 Tax=Chlamydomonas eustigma TaxID=1157962 RepID=A0A250XAP5_9CHLO|nr:hypothetical protein CEUSTIGMA_g7585.t1 [Chlamydomonas eustigma]|eukprot:GAX80147.1 hypothetical protein CEUSTIGMA_g7585.t1 [Chlamydomonas eustigma]